MGQSKTPYTLSQSTKTVNHGSKPMCNTLDPLGKKIPEAGIGYKIFGPRLVSCFEELPYKTDPQKGVTWENNGSNSIGFCFFLERKEAERLLADLRERDGRYTFPIYSKHSVEKIIYRQGIQKQLEHDIIWGKTYTM